jgi:hypothetical protein
MGDLTKVLIYLGQVIGSNMINEINFNNRKNLGPITTMKMQNSKQIMTIV